MDLERYIVYIIAAPYLPISNNLSLHLPYHIFTFSHIQVWQYVSLMKRIYLIDCPGVVYPSGESQTEVVLKGVVSCQLFIYSIHFLAQLHPHLQPSPRKLSLAPLLAPPNPVPRSVWKMSHRPRTTSEPYWIE